MSVSIHLEERVNGKYKHNTIAQPDVYQESEMGDCFYQFWIRIGKHGCAFSFVCDEFNDQPASPEWRGCGINWLNYQLGMLFGGVLFGLVGDRFGRVKTFSYTIFIFAFATAAMAFANNITLIYALRFLAGIGAGGEYGVGISLIAESFHKNQIGKMTSVAAIGGQIGAILAAIAAAFIIPNLGWHALFLLGLVPVVLTYFVRRHLTETQEFVEAKKTEKESTTSAVFKYMFSSPKLAYQSFALMIMTTVQIAGYFG